MAATQMSFPLFFRHDLQCLCTMATHSILLNPLTDLPPFLNHAELPLLSMCGYIRLYLVPLLYERVAHGQGHRMLPIGGACP